MNVQRLDPGQGQKVFGQDLTVGGGDEQIRPQLGQFGLDSVVLDPARLKKGQIIGLGLFLDRRRGHDPFAASRFIRLGDHADHPPIALRPGLDQAGQNYPGRLRSAQKDDPTGH